MTLASAGPGLTTGYVMRRAAGPLSAGVAAPGTGGLTVWPNPAGAREVWVQGAPAGATVDVLDLLGRPVFHGIMPGTGPLRVALPLPVGAGMYVVRSGRQTQKVLVQ